MWFRTRFLWGIFAVAIFTIGIWMSQYSESRSTDALAGTEIGRLDSGRFMDTGPSLTPLLVIGLPLLVWLAFNWRIGISSKRSLQRALEEHKLSEIILQANASGTRNLGRTIRSAITGIGQEGLIQELADFGDSRLVVPMAELLSASPKERSSARNILVRLLPDITPENSDMLAKSSLYFHMSYPDMWQEGDEELIKAILETVERVGAVEALPHLKRLVAEERVPGEIYKLGNRCLAAISSRENLLRPSSDPAQVSELLLRSAQNNTEDTSALLRAIEEA
jgi:hypothetical protein